MTVPAFQLTDARKQYGDSLVVDIDKLDIPPGEIFCLLGPTGSGKSTLLRLLAAVESATSGRIAYQGEVVEEGTLPLATRRRWAMVFQRPILLTGTVRWNVGYALRLRGKTSETEQSVDDVMERLGLARIAEQSAQTLSGGQTQLVALARAIVLRPDVLFLDEPTANLDPGHVGLVEDVITAEQRERGMTVAWATHNLFQARRVAGRVALLLGGRLVEVASTEHFFHSPKDPRTTDFVEGKMIY